MTSSAKMASSVVSCLVLCAGMGWVWSQASGSPHDMAEGIRLYDRGNYEEALPLLEEAAAEGVEDGGLYYRLAYLYQLSGMYDQARSYQERALPLLQKQTESGNPTLGSFYYLAALHAALGNQPAVRRTAQAGIARFAQARKLSGEDLFRLGRLHQFLGDRKSSYKAYSEAIELFRAQKEPNPVLFSLALVAGAGSDLEHRRYQEASENLAQAAKIDQKVSINQFEAALAHLGAGKYEAAAGSFALAANEGLNVEAQYGVDVARRLGKAGGMVEDLEDGRTVRDLTDPEIEAEIARLIPLLRQLKDRTARGQDVSEEKMKTNQLFFSLLAEQMLRGKLIRESSLAGGYADLIRRQ